MASLTGQTIAATYKRILTIDSENFAADDSAKYIKDGDAGTSSALSLSTTRVGIGTDSPAALLQVQKAVVGTDNNIDDLLILTKVSDQVSGFSDDFGVAIKFQCDASSGGLMNAGRIACTQDGSGGNSQMRFYTLDGSTLGQKMVINNEGNVGIGTDAPENLLHIVDIAVEADSIIYDSHSQLIVEDTDARIQIISSNNDDNASALILSSVVDESSGGDVDSWFLHHYGIGKSGKFGIGYNANQTADEDVITNKTLATDPFTILTSGNVGIGNTAPAAPLSVYQNTAGAQDIAHFRHNDTTEDFVIHYNGTDMQFRDEVAGAGDLWMTFKDGGDVGIGTPTPDRKLDVSQTSATAAVFQRTGSEDNCNIEFKNDTDSIFVGMNASENFAVGTTANLVASATTPFTVDLTNGRVGIGTLTPGVNLDISTTAGAGNVYIELDANTGEDTGILFSLETVRQWNIQCVNGGNLGVYDYSDSTTAVHIVEGGNVWVSDSDERIKKDVENIGSSLDSINQLRPITYKNKYGKLDKTHVGLIAQETKPHFPLVVEGDENDFELRTPTEENPDKHKGAMGIGYSDFVPYLIKAIQELSTKVTALENA